MRRKKLSLMDISDDETLSRDEMKYIMAGSGGGNGLCDVYCCDHSGNCSINVSTSHSCTSNEDCQSWARGRFTCESGYYIAGYC